MKRTLCIFLVILALAIATVSARLETAGPGDPSLSNRAGDPNLVGNQTSGETAVENTIVDSAGAVKDSTLRDRIVSDPGRCVNFLQTNYPQASLATARTVCAKILANRDIATAQTGMLTAISDQARMRLRMFSQEKLTNISTLSSDKLERLASAANIDKLTMLSKQELSNIADLSEEDLSDLSRLSAAQIKKYADLSLTNLKEIKFSSEAKAEDDFITAALKMRNITPTMHSESLKAATDYANLKSTLADDRKAFVDSRAALKACSTGCDTLQADVLAKAKTYLNAAVDAMIGQIDEQIASLQADPNVAATDISSLSAELNGRRTSLLSIKTELESATTKGQIQSIAASIGTMYEKVRASVANAAVRSRQMKVGEIIARADLLERKMTEVTTQMKQDGIDVPGADQLILSFSQDVAQAKKDYDDALKIWLSMRNTGTDPTLVKQANDLLQDAHNSLQSANSVLRQLIALIKQNGGEVDSRTMPNYIPGKDLGVYAWQDASNRWNICVSSDGQQHTATGTISANSFCAVQPYFWESSTDHYAVQNGTISFTDVVEPHQDCLAFRATSTPITVAATIDGQSVPIIFGRDNTKIASPAKLDGKASLCPTLTSIKPTTCPVTGQPVCGGNGVTYSNICQLKKADATLAHSGPCDVQPGSDTEIACTTASDCACGTRQSTNECFVGNKAYVNVNGQCPDFCGGIAGNLVVSCVANKCTQVAVTPTPSN